MNSKSNHSQSLYDTASKLTGRFRRMIQEMNLATEFDAADLVHETFVVCAGRYPKSNWSNKDRRLLVTVARNLCVDRIRHRRRTVQLDPMVSTPLDRPCACTDDPQTRDVMGLRRLRTALRDLPEQDRQVLVQRADGLSLADIARATRTSPNTVRSSYRRSLARLRAIMGRNDLVERFHRAGSPPRARK